MNLSNGQINTCIINWNNPTIWIITFGWEKIFNVSKPACIYTYLFIQLPRFSAYSVWILQTKINILRIKHKQVILMDYTRQYLNICARTAFSFSSIEWKTFHNIAHSSELQPWTQASWHPIVQLFKARYSKRFCSPCSFITLPQP